MKKGKYLAAPRRKRKKAVILLAAAALLLAAVSVLLVGRLGGQQGVRQAKLPNSETAPQSDSAEKQTDSIAIPGYEGISLKANSKEQEIGFPNPAQNTCYFQISLMLEDGTLLWRSELVAPGEISDPITLEEPLEAGVYPNALLKFDCYTMDGAMRALNGAATKMTLHVK